MSNSFARAFSDICGSSLTNDLGKYLDVPLIHSRITKSTYSEIIDKVHGRLAGWKCKTLSMAGRLTIINAANIALESQKQCSIFSGTALKLKRFGRLLVCLPLFCERSTLTGRAGMLQRSSKSTANSLESSGINSLSSHVGSLGSGEVSTSLMPISKVPIMPPLLSSRAYLNGIMQACPISTTVILELRCYVRRSLW